MRINYNLHAKRMNIINITLSKKKTVTKRVHGVIAFL